MLSSLVVNESGAPGLWSPLQLQSPKERFCLLSAQAQKALWHPSNLCFFRGLSVINSLPDRILAGSYNGMYFQGSHFMTRKVGSVFPGGCWHHESISSDSVFKIPVHTAVHCR